MTCQRVPLPGGGVAILCGADRPVKRPTERRCSRCREMFTPPHAGMQTICPLCVEDLS